MEAFVKLIYDDWEIHRDGGHIIGNQWTETCGEKLVSLNGHLAITSSKLSTAAQLAAGIAHEVRESDDGDNGIREAD